MNQETVRCFFAIVPPSGARTEITSLIQILQRQIDPILVRWTPEENLHVTLRFIGEFPKLALTHLIKQTEVAISTIHTLDLTVNAITLFPDRHYPKTLALTFLDDSRLKQLALMIEDCVTDCGVKPETRQFRPHLSLASFREPNHVSIDDNFPPFQLKFLCNEIVILKSITLPAGARYQLMHRFSLRD